MQVQGTNMMDMGGSPAAAFWGARHPSWPTHSHATPVTSAPSHSDPKMAEKLMSELQVRFGERRRCVRVGVGEGRVGERRRCGRVGVGGGRVGERRRCGRGRMSRFS